MYRWNTSRREQIFAAIKRGDRVIDIKRSTGCCHRTIANFRALLGDTEDRRKRRKLSDTALAQAEEMLWQGRTWPFVAQTFGVTEVMLRENLAFRARDRRARQRERILAALKTKTGYAVAKQMKVSRTMVYRIKKEARMNA